MNIWCFGDSHSRYFTVTDQIKNINPVLYLYSIINNPINAATINGFGKRESTLNSKKIINETITKNSVDVLVMNFGQVDVELGYYYKYYVKKEYLMFVDFASYIIDVYISYIKQQPVKIKIVKGINPPVLCYNRDKALQYTKRIITENILDKKIINTLYNDMEYSFPDDIERTKRHLVFNSLLKKKCKENKISYFDITKELLSENGLIKIDFVPSKKDHHLVDSLRTRNLYINSLIETIEGI